jgi:hypothetical protein
MFSTNFTVLYCGLSIVSGIVAAVVAHSKRSKQLPAALGFFLGFIAPVIGIFIVLLLARQTVEKKITGGAMKVCPHCGNVVNPRGSICPVCQDNMG